MVEGGRERVASFSLRGQGFRDPAGALSGAGSSPSCLFGKLSPANVMKGVPSQDGAAAPVSQLIREV